MNRKIAGRLERLWYPAAAGAGEPPRALRLAAALYGFAVRARGTRYDRGAGASRRLPVPCVAVGNLSVGGTGKTPLVAWITERFLAAGARPAIVSRGYGGRERGPAVVPAAGGAAAAARFGDEPALLAARFPQVPVVVGHDRHAAGMLAVRGAGTTVVVADDAFQHRRLARDFDVVVVDATRGLGNGRLLPAGPLREAPEALARAGAIVLNRVGEAQCPGELRRRLARLAPRALIAESDLAFAGWRNARTGAAAELPPGTGIYAFCGIANPGSFRRTLEGQGARLLGWEVFPDHHRYRAGELEELARAAAAVGAAAAVTTAKDAARIPRWPGAAPLYRAEVKLVMLKNDEQLWQALKSLAARGG
ncbi:MAG TPA: tetraacyldisaccharide 4'-kinase [Candidatus Methanoperedens sp.]|nr:tetraacyldisaccharide 4'-kinase [Candidatus Methanoperedens sp.]